MQNAETVLREIRKNGVEGKPLERIYRLLYNPTLYLLAYSQIYANKGMMTPGTTSETADGMSLKVIDRIIEDIRYERFRWTPVRRVLIPKSNGKKRPLGIPTFTDKLVQGVIRNILEAYYEPHFSPQSHGFRPDKGCHTALREIHKTWTGTKWFIEGDISQCFDAINHDRLIGIMRESIHDERFLRLIHNLLKSGYIENWTYNTTYSGTPQGGIVSPILANIYLDQLDKFVEGIIPEYTRGKERKHTRVYVSLGERKRRAYRRGDIITGRILEKQQQAMPARDPMDEGHRRLRYIRYADDFLLAFCGPKAEAEEIKGRIKDYLSSDLMLQMSEEKTVITNATNERASFLGYEIGIITDNSAHTKGGRSINGRVGLFVPDKVQQRIVSRYTTKQGTPRNRPEKMREDEFSIIFDYQAEWRGIVQYYKLAHNIRTLSMTQYKMFWSLLKTLAAKHNSSAAKMYREHRGKYLHQNGTTYNVLEATREKQDGTKMTARFGGIPLKRDITAELQDRIGKLTYSGHTEILQRLQAQTCEICGSQLDIEVHHVRKLSDIKKRLRNRKGGENAWWMVKMAAMNRKTLITCENCHKDIHRGTLP